jgi:hypothetical protein
MAQQSWDAEGGIHHAAQFVRSSHAGTAAMNARFTLHSSAVLSNAVGTTLQGDDTSRKDKPMPGGTFKVAAWTAAAALSITLASGDAFARPGGGRDGHPGYHGGSGYHGGNVYRGNVHRGGVYHGGGAYRGARPYHGMNRGVVVHGAPRIGGRYYGGTWYGPGRRFWNNRWYAYGVGPCWLWSPIGYVWICG